MSKMVKVQLDFPKEFVRHLDNMVKSVVAPAPVVTPNEWFRKTTAGQEFYRDLVYKHVYVHLSDKELAKVIREKMKEDLGIEVAIGRPPLMQERVRLIMEAFHVAHPVGGEAAPPPEEKHRFVQGVGWIHPKS